MINRLLITPVPNGYTRNVFFLFLYIATLKHCRTNNDKVISLRLLITSVLNGYTRNVFSFSLT